MTRNFRMRTHRWLFAAVTAASVTAVAAPALADAIVSVQVRDPNRRPVDGRVTLTPTEAGRPSFSCQTQGGACRMEGVAGGQYTVSFAPTQGSPPPSKTVMVPPSGTVQLIVAAGP